MSPPASPEDARAFARRVLALVRKLYPDQPAALGADGETLRLGSAQFGLSNLAAKFRQAGGGAALLRRLVKAHFDQLLRDAATLVGTISWGEAKPILLPQLMPESFLEQLPLAERPFAPAVRIGLVIDAPSGYRYVRRDELNGWDLSLDQVLAVALDNLTTRSAGLQIHARTGADRILMLATGDGYDAARILLPRWRELAGEHLGLPFRFGIPNRDFLICWSADSTAGTQAAFRARIAEDYGRQPYPLSPLTFEMNSEGNVRPLP